MICFLIFYWILLIVIFKTYSTIFFSDNEQKIYSLSGLNDLKATKGPQRLNIALKRKRSYGEVFMTNSELAVAPMHRLCKKAGADRVSEAAAKELAKALEGIGIKIAKEALDFAMHAGRKTIKAEDIEIASKKVMEK